MRMLIGSLDKPAKGPSLALALDENFTNAKNVMLVTSIWSVKIGQMLWKSIWPRFSALSCELLREKMADSLNIADYLERIDYQDKREPSLGIFSDCIAH